MSERAPRYAVGPRAVDPHRLVSAVSYQIVCAVCGKEWVVRQRSSMMRCPHCEARREVKTR